MQTITPDFLRSVQRSGWLIDYVVDGLAAGQCPRAGCGLRVNLRPGSQIPQTCRPSEILAGVPVQDFATMQRILAERREALGLSQTDLDECIDLSPDPAGKMEGGARTPAVTSLFGWAAALGYEVVVQHAGLPPKTLAVVARTRAKAALKRRKYLAKRAKASCL
ncbi:MAG: helix-turn-helix transcriptional regulator [Tabrizicola sp.]|nr:helix-turn-helix transcriptional regulator [Tabrizicola sp.]